MLPTAQDDHVEDSAVLRNLNQKIHFGAMHSAVEELSQMSMTAATPPVPSLRHSTHFLISFEILFFLNFLAIKNITKIRI
jgi:hypothetical protein